MGLFVGGGGGRDALEGCGGGFCRRFVNGSGAMWFPELGWKWGHQGVHGRSMRVSLEVESMQNWYSILDI